MPTLNRTHLIVAVAGITAAATVAILLTANGHTPHNDHEQTTTGMNQRAQQVMPFDLAKTTHTFTKTPSGGVEQVVANGQRDTRNITLIRSHLTYEVGQFRKGDYNDPARIHGTDMPGVKELSAGASRVTIAYQQTPAGARLTYSSTDPRLVTALHQWFDRQNSDHNMPGMGGDHN